MKLIYLHGDDREMLETRLKKFVEHAKSKNMRRDYFDFEKGDSVKSAVRAKTIFEEENIYIFKNFSKHIIEDIKFINKHEGDETLIFVAKNALTKTVFKGLEVKLHIEEFKLPFIVFKMFDAILPGEFDNFAQIHREVEKLYSSEFIVGLMARHLKNLYWVLESPSSAPLPSWQIAKLEKQAGAFGKKRVCTLVDNLSEIDEKIKRGESLHTLLDLTLVKLLQ